MLPLAEAAKQKSLAGSNSPWAHDKLVTMRTPNREKGGAGRLPLLEAPLAGKWLPGNWIHSSQNQMLARKRGLVRFRTDPKGRKM